MLIATREGKKSSLTDELSSWWSMSYVHTPYLSGLREKLRKEECSCLIRNLPSRYGDLLEIRGWLYSVT